MCKGIDRIAKTKNGEIIQCKECGNYHITFNNIFFEFTPKEYKQFKEYLFNINTDYWEHNYPCRYIHKNIPIPSLQKNLILIFNRQEITELRRLFLFRNHSKYKSLGLNDIDYKFILN